MGIMWAVLSTSSPARQQAVRSAKEYSREGYCSGQCTRRDRQEWSLSRVSEIVHVGSIVHGVWCMRASLSLTYQRHHLGQSAQAMHWKISKACESALHLESTMARDRHHCTYTCCKSLSRQLTQIQVLWHYGQRLQNCSGLRLRLSRDCSYEVPSLVMINKLPKLQSIECVQHRIAHM